VDDVNFAGWTPEKSIQVIQDDRGTHVLVKGRPYMSWPSGDEGSVRMAIVQLSGCGLGAREELAKVFEVHVNSVQRYLTDFEREGMRGLISGRSGPKQPWKLTPALRGKILLIVLREGIGKLEAIQQRLAEAWGEEVSVASIQQVLAENGLGEPSARGVRTEAVTGELFAAEPEPQLELRDRLSPGLFAGATSLSGPVGTGRLQRVCRWTVVCAVVGAL
jgi:transposase